jgi:hypothetical protein
VIIEAAAAAATVGLVGAVGWYALLRRGAIHAPYSGLSHRVAWAGGFPERAYNFGEVEPGRLWRSSRPDPRFLAHLRDLRGLRRVLSLNGTKRNDFHDRVEELGLELVVRKWSNNRVPPEESLEEVLSLMRDGTPTLVHCGAGKDRTGFAVACYRLEAQDWSVEEAVREMRRHWHRPHQRPWFHEALRSRYPGR